MYRKSSMTSAIVLIVIAALVVFIGYGSSIDGKWFKNSDVSKWYNSWGKGETVQTNDQTDNQNGSQNGNQNGNVTPVQTGSNDQLMIGESEGTGLTLLCAPIDDLTVVSLADAPANYISVYSLTCTYQPSYATAPVIDWSVLFQNPSSAWASGKNISDYVLVVPDRDGSLTATAYCLQGFGEQVLIKAAFRNDSAIYCTVTCDYLAKVSGFQYLFAGNNSVGDFSLTPSVDTFDCLDMNYYPASDIPSYFGSGSASVVLSYSDAAYTTVPQVSSYILHVYITPDFRNALIAEGLNVVATDVDLCAASNSTNVHTVDPNNISYYDLIWSLFTTKSDIYSRNSDFNKVNYGKVVSAMRACGSSNIFQVSLSVTCGTHVYPRNWNLKVSSASLQNISATSISMSGGSLVF